jgi:hypothetical protein
VRETVSYFSDLLTLGLDREHQLQYAETATTIGRSPVKRKGKERKCFSYCPDVG